MRKFSKMSANNKTSVFKYIVLAERSDGESLSDVRGVSVIALGQASPVNELKNNSRGGKCMSCKFSAQSMYSYGKTLFRVSNLNSSSNNVGNCECTIFNLYLSRYDVNLLRLALRNLKQSMNLNLTQFRNSFLMVS